MAEKINQIEINGTTYDLQDKDAKQPFTGTRAEVDAAIANGTIKDGDIVNITDDFNLGNLIAVTNLVVPSSAWKTDYTYENYPVCADIEVKGVDSRYSPDVRLGYQLEQDGVIRLASCSNENTLTLYGSTGYEEDITIPVVIFQKVGNMIGTVSGSGSGGGSKPIEVAMVLVSESRTFNIKEIVGEEYLKEYSVNDFVVCNNTANAQTPTSGSFGGTGNAYGQYRKDTDPVLSYNSATGDVTITDGTFTVVGYVYTTQNKACGISSQFTMEVKVYLCVKTPNPTMPSDLTIPDKSKLLSSEFTSEDNEGNITHYKEIYENGEVVETIYYDKEGNIVEE